MTSTSPTAWMFDRDIKGIVHDPNELAGADVEIYKKMMEIAGGPVTEIAATGCSRNPCVNCGSFIRTAVHCPVCGRLATKTDGLVHICKCRSVLSVCCYGMIRMVAKTFNLCDEEDTV